MMLLRNYNFKGKRKHIFLAKILTFIILIWIYDQNNVPSFGTYLKKKTYHDSIFTACFNRSLAKHGTQMYEKYQKQGQNLNDGKMNKIIKDDKENYEYLKKGLNNLDSHKKDYKKRQDRKKGLARLDCYYEKKIFDKMEYVEELARKFKNDKKTFKKKVYKKYGYFLIIFTLIPVLGLIMPLYFNKYNPLLKKWCLRVCLSKHKKDEPNFTESEIENAIQHHETKGRFVMSITKDTWNVIYIVNTVFLCLSFIIVLSVIIYIMLKVIKYEKLKAGKGKMNLREYCHFCKNILYKKCQQ
ncbi:hypothetical protein PVNG_03107 [Plasmodium vivax North Korean]|uniref:Variable surface protein Vir35 n=1 Tax=Plasmodium vivax North Korean TaxID=1035514 RepID=A0A0J9TZ28_PLAVI|nr:hypothetical protein PVNG_03107 [Plasmodium vivax North Korean]